ncbi:ACR3 family arsenite efflux transporter [Pseudovibrio exalbescens]|uniref:ACR3 family arsenite efflux transporter n=1 Tax=Pseudovibrio exalbescens TaxID=197461 RepID=UPI002366018B|nr:ACR3 family arsenite efflux transporter [Pseudovibrio exalbescens]MDD7911636.1 ACR3 family arsenite efflux transporter [Pseudovibrio exalbescens]
MSLFERYLTVWVALAMVSGVAANAMLPSLFAWIAATEIYGINLVITILIWLMIYPMMIAVKFTEVRNCFRQPQGLMITIIMNWLIKPFSMALLAIVFMRFVYAGLIETETADAYIAGMILLGVAPCTAMVFVWSYLTKGNPGYTVTQVAVNDLIMLFAFAPITALLLGLSEIFVPWDLLIISVFLFVVLPLGAGVLTRQLLKTEAAIQRFTVSLKPLSIFGLVATVFILFGLQADNILSNPTDIVLIAIPLIIQTVLIFYLTYKWMERWRQPHNIAAPGAMIGASNFFELAVAVAIALFGVHSGAALATIVGVLVEVPLMLALVRYANRTRTSYDLAVGDNSEVTAKY